MGSGAFLINMCAGIEPRAVNCDIVTPRESEEDQMLNAKYAISFARKLDAVPKPNKNKGFLKRVYYSDLKWQNLHLKLNHKDPQ